MVIGFKSDAIADVNGKMEKLLDNLAFYCYDGCGSANYEYYKENLLNDYSDDIKTTEDIVWDNGMNSREAIASQYCSIYGEIGVAADDFLFENDTKVMGVKWVGAYWKGGDSDFDMEIIFYYNRSEGNVPGDIYAGPFFHPNEETNETHVEENWFCYNVSLPEPILFPGGEKFWVSIQSIANILPQWGTGVHETPQRLATLCWKGEHFDVFDWVHSEDRFGFFWDLSFQLTGEENLPPNAPTITGETEGKVGKEYEYKFNAIDPNGDDVKYFIDWGDNTTDWTGYNLSGTDVNVNHTWVEKGNYTIKAKAVDMYGAESEWGTLEVTMPKSKPFNFNFPLISWLLERFPLLNERRLCVVWGNNDYLCSSVLTYHTIYITISIIIT